MTEKDSIPDSQDLDVILQALNDVNQDDVSKDFVSSSPIAGDAPAQIVSLDDASVIFPVKDTAHDSENLNETIDLEETTSKNFSSSSPVAVNVQTRLVDHEGVSDLEGNGTPESTYSDGSFSLEDTIINLSEKPKTSCTVASPTNTLASDNLIENEKSVINEYDPLNSFQVTMDVERSRASYNELLSSYAQIFDELKQCRANVNVAEQEITCLQNKINDQHNEIVSIQREMNEKNIERERLEDGLKSTLEEEIIQKNEKIRLMEEEQKVQDLEKEVTR